MNDPFTRAFVAMDDGAAALRKLDATCCVPGRSPRMAALAETMSAARAALETLAPGDDITPVTLLLEDAGGQVGRLQVGCCAANRLPLYARILEDLTTIQMTLDQVSGDMSH